MRAGEPGKARERHAARIRLGPAIAQAVAGATEAIDGIHEAEILPALGPQPARSPGLWAHRVPRRIQQSPIVLMRPLQVGWGSAPEAFRRRWESMERGMPGGTTALDLAWFASDGTRDLAEIADRLADEGTNVSPELLEDFIELLVEMGACEWSAGKGT